MNIEEVKIEKDAETNVIIGQSHFMKTAEDLYEALVNSVPRMKFGLAFCEASMERLIRSEGNDEELQRLAEKNAKAARVAYERAEVGTCKGTLEYPEEKKWLPTAQEFPTGGALGLEVQTEGGLIGLGSFVENHTGSWRTFMPWWTTPSA